MMKFRLPFKCIFHFLLLLLSVKICAQDTFSIVAVDEDTKEVGAAGASCIPGAASFGGVILISGIIPGKGGVNGQAYICINPHINLDNALRRMRMGDSPQQIIDWLRANDACSSANFNPEFRQYGVVDFGPDGKGRSAAFTGNQADNWKGHRTGPNYSIQGNILLGPQILDSMEARFLRTQGSLAEKLMAAMQGANVPGADARCLSAGTSSTSAFLRVFKPDDNPNAPYLQLNVIETPRGVEPVDSLQSLFDQWRLSKTRSPRTGMETLKVYPNPSAGFLIIELDGKLPSFENLNYTFYDIWGNMRLEGRLNSSKQKINTAQLETGIYFLKVSDRTGVFQKYLRIISL